MQDQPETLFRVLVIAPLRAAGDYATNNGWVAPVRFTRDGFDREMAPVAPGLELDLEARGRKHSVSHTFKGMKGFGPGALVEQVPLFAAAHRAAGASGGGTQSSVIDDILSASSPVHEGVENPPLEAFVRHPAVRSLERAWRGVHLLASRAGDGVVVDAIDAPIEDVASVLEARQGDAHTTDLIVIDYELTSSRRHLDYLLEWAKLAEALGAPVVTNGTPELLGMNDLASLGTTERRLRNSDDPRAVAFRTTVAKEVTRSVCVALNGALARAPYEGPVEGAPGLSLEDREPLFLGPAVLVAAIAIENAARSGWACPGTGTLGGLPTMSIEGVPIASEALVTPSAAEEAAAAGIAFFRPGRGEVRLSHAPMAHRPAPRQGIAAAPAPHVLADPLFVSRAAGAIATIAAEIPASTPAAKVREVMLVALADVFGSEEPVPEVQVSAGGGRVEVTLRPRGFGGASLEAVTLGARFG